MSMRCMAGALALALGLAVPTVRAATPAGPDADAMWTQMLEHGDYDKALERLGVIDAIGYDGRNVDAAQCSAHAADLQALVEAAPVSLAARRAAYLCAQASGDEAGADREMAVLTALSRHALQQAGDPELAPPIRIMLPIDAYSLTISTGLDVSYEYYTGLWPAPYLSHVLVLFDEEKGTERHLAFDYVDTAFRTSREVAAIPYPGSRIGLAVGFVQGLSNAESQAGVDNAALMAAWEAAAPDRVAKLRGATARGGIQSARAWLTVCAVDAQPDCGDGLVDELLTLAENKDALPMVLLAYAYIEGVGTRADPEAGLALLDGAARRWTGALASYGDLWNDVHGIATPYPPALQQRLDKAVAAGNTGARLLLLRQRVESKGVLEQGDIDFLAADAQNRLGKGLELLARHAEHNGQAADAQAWTAKAAEAGNDLALRRIGSELAFAQDPAARARGRRLLEASAQGGNWLAARALSYLSMLDADYKGAQGWLLGPVIQKDPDAMLSLAELYLEDWPGLEPALKPLTLLKLLEPTREYGPRARRLLARMASQGRGMAKDPAQARAWLLKDAEAGDVVSQLQLAAGLLKGEFGAADEAEGLRWMEKAAATGDERAITSYASWLYYERKTPEARKQALDLLSASTQAGKSGPINNYAWLLCTSPDAQVYDPARGLALMDTLDPFSRRQPGTMDTLAACHAANGDFATAVALQETAARQLAAVRPHSAGDKARTPGYEKRLALYRAGKRYQEFEHNE